MANGMKVKHNGQWMQTAVKHPGAFTKKAKAAGMSVGAYAAKVTKPGSTASAQTKRQANLAKTFRKIAKKKKGGSKGKGKSARRPKPFSKRERTANMTADEAGKAM